MFNSYTSELTTIFFLSLFLLRENLLFRLLFLALVEPEANAQFIVNFVGLKIKVWPKKFRKNLT